MDSSSTIGTAPRAVKLKPIDAMPASFAAFGQVISAAPDGQEFGPHDAQLELHRGTPSFHVATETQLGWIHPPPSRRCPGLSKLKPIDATPASFAAFGQVISAASDRQEFGTHDAQLELHHGTPRFYIMHLEDRELKFSKITHHASVTQCLGSVGGKEWYLGIAKASIVDGSEVSNDVAKKPVQSACGHYYMPPNPDEICVFRIVGSQFLKLNAGTWHAGPLFRTKAMDFYNLELSNTNVVDHTTHDFDEKDGVMFVVDD